MEIIFTPDLCGMQPDQLRDYLQDLSLDEEFYNQLNNFVNDIEDHLSHNDGIPCDTRMLMEQAKVIIYSLSESIEMLAGGNG